MFAKSSYKHSSFLNQICNYSSHHKGVALLRLSIVLISSFKSLTSIFSSLSLLTISLISLPAKAALPCEYGTVNTYQNGSVASCTIENNVDIRIGTFNFPCKKGYPISFDEKGQFESCVISAPVSIRTGNTVKTCLEESMVYVSVSDTGDQSVSCSRSK